jgi:hypothetical protein
MMSVSVERENDEKDKEKKRSVLFINTDNWFLIANITSFREKIFIF